MDKDEIRSFFIEVLDEYFASYGAIAPRWENGKVVLQPAGDTQSKEVPIEVFFKKLLTVRDSLRVLEQKINTNPDLPQVEKANLQAYITKAYGALTTFNILFKDDKDKFHGSGGSKPGKAEGNMSINAAKRKIGLNEY